MMSDSSDNTKMRAETVEEPSLCEEESLRPLLTDARYFPPAPENLTPLVMRRISAARARRARAAVIRRFAAVAAAVLILVPAVTVLAPMLRRAADTAEEAVKDRAELYAAPAAPGEVLYATLTDGTDGDGTLASVDEADTGGGITTASAADEIGKTEAAQDGAADGEESVAANSVLSAEVTTAAGITEAPAEATSSAPPETTGQEISTMGTGVPVAPQEKDRATMIRESDPALFDDLAKIVGEEKLAAWIEAYSGSVADAAEAARIYFAEEIASAKNSALDNKTPNGEHPLGVLFV